MELYQAIQGRRSIRKFTPDIPADKDLSYVLEAARWAPSWANTQCWECIVVRDAGTRTRLAAYVPAGNPARSAVAQAPIVLVACGRRAVSGYFKGQPATDTGDWLLFDVALALQNLTLAAYERGLGTVHVGFFDAAEVARELGVPEDLAVVELMPLGFPAQEGRVTPRKPLAESVSYERFGQRQG